MRKNTKIQVALLSIFGIIFIIYIINSINYTKNDDYFSQKQLDEGDSLLFTLNSLKNFKVESVIKTDYRGKLKRFNYKKVYDFYFTKIPLKKDITIGELISFKEETISTASFETYYYLDLAKSYDVQVRATKLDPITKVFFSMTGEMDKMRRKVYTKDLVSYYLPLNSFSLRYEDEDNPVDILVKEDVYRIFIREGIPFVVSFYKKQKSLYVFLISPIDKNTPINEKIISELVNY